MPKCIEDGCSALAAGTRCQEHERQRQRRRKASRSHYRAGWERFARDWLDQWTALNGPLCVGWKRVPHLVTRADLTLDHVDPRGSSGGFQALCRSCNGSKGDRDAMEGSELRR